METGDKNLCGSGQQTEEQDISQYRVRARYLLSPGRTEKIKP